MGTIGEGLYQDAIAPICQARHAIIGGADHVVQHPIVVWRVLFRHWVSYDDPIHLIAGYEISGPKVNPPDDNIVTAFPDVYADPVRSRVAVFSRADLISLNVKVAGV